MKEAVVSEKENGLRFDEALFRLGGYASRSQAQSLIKEGKALLNGKKEKAHEPVKTGDLLSFEAYQEPVSALTPQDIPLDIVYEDDYLLVINKQAGLVVHPGNGNPDGTLVNALLFHQKQLAPSEDPLRPGIVHRIDKDTSGLLVVAKTEEALLGLQAQLAGHAMHREYLALCEGVVKEEEGKIIAPLARDKQNPLKMAVDLNGKEAITYFKTKERFPYDRMSLLDCRLLTGRTHQIRVHLDYIGHPVEGDPLYGRNNHRFYSKGQLLHAYRLTFVHPVTKKEMSFEAPLPDYFQSIVDKLHERSTRS